MVLQPSQSAVLWLRWVARVSSVASLALIVAFAADTDGIPNLTEMIGIAFFPAGVAIGFLIAWWREGIGGVFSVLSLLGFYVWYLAVTGRLPHGPYFILFSAPGVLFFSTWFVSQEWGSKRTLDG